MAESLIPKEKEPKSEVKLRALLNSWSPDRLGVLCLLTGTVPEDFGIKIEPEQPAMIRIRSMHETLVNNLNFPDKEPLTNSVQMYLDVVSPSFKLTPLEMIQITTHEALAGLLYLDSLADIYPLLTETFSRSSKDLRIRRKIAIQEKLRYGAKLPEQTRLDEQRFLDDGAVRPARKKA